MARTYGRRQNAADGQAWPLKCAIVRNGATETRIDVFDDVGEGPFSQGLSAKDFAAQLAEVKGPLSVHVSSSGGSVFDGIAIANSIRNYRGFKRTFNDGLAASIASVIFQAGDERVAEPGSMTMIHEAHGLCLGTSDEARKFAETLDQVSDNIAGIYASRAGGTIQQWRTAMKAETWYTAEETVAAGLADRVGASVARLPESVAMAPAASLPGKIAAQLRTLPKAQQLRDQAAREKAARAFAALTPQEQRKMIAELQSALGGLSGNPRGRR